MHHIFPRLRVETLSARVMVQFLMLLIAASTPLRAGADGAKIELSITTPKVIRVTDEDGLPIAKARVAVGWWEDSAGELLIVAIVDPPVTNAKGEVTIHVPRGAVRAQISAKSDGFAKSGGQISLKGNPVLRLKQGRIIRVRALDTNGNVLPDAFPLLSASRIFGREFKAAGDGVHVSPVVHLNRRWLRVIEQAGKDTSLRFSEMIDVANPPNVDKDGVIDVTLEQGVRLEGRLADTVPRPIKKGIVELIIVEGEGQRISIGDRPWAWQDTAEVSEDGSFVFESLPRGGHVQLFALVDGWQSVDPTPEELRDYFAKHNAGADIVIERALERPGIWPRLFPLDRDKVSVTLPCRKTTSLDVYVVDPSGSPIPDATAHFNPNGYFLGGELFIPGTEMSTRMMIRPGAGNQLLFGNRKVGVANGFLIVKTDKQGLARIRNLPGTGTESYRVEANGYVMSAYPTSRPEDPQRYALVDRESGLTLQRTITMERDVPSKPREVLVVDSKGKPLNDIKVTVTEIAMLPVAERWQTWSVQRFGPIVSAQSGEDGRAILHTPTRVGNQRVVRIRLAVDGRIGRQGYARGTVNLPALADGRVIRLAATEPKPNARPGQLTRWLPRYVRPESLLSDSPQELVQQLYEKPSLILLRQLLALAKFDDAEPVEFKVHRSPFNWDNPRSVVRLTPKLSNSKPGTSKSAGEKYPYVALCTVRPKGSADSERSLPSAAFVFRPDGTLLRMLGGGYSAKGSAEHCVLVNLGHAGDWFVSVDAFENNRPFEKVTRWFRITDRVALPSLTIHHYANSVGYSVPNGPSVPISEYGYMEYEFNGQDIEHHLPGTTPDGLLAPRRIVWDGRRNQFIAPSTLSFKKRPLYRIDVEGSAEFQPLEVKADHIVSGGGRRDYANWHQWTVTIQKSQNVVARLSIRSADRSQTEVLNERRLVSGQHNLQLQIDPQKQSKTTSTARLRIDGGNDNETVLEISHMQIDKSPSVADQPAAFSQKAPVRLFDKKLTDGRSLVWSIESGPAIPSE